MRRTALLSLFLLAGLLGFVAGALTPQLLAQPMLSALQSEPAYADISREYSLGYEVTLKVGGQNITVASSNASLGQGPRVGAVSLAYGLGYALGAENYTYHGVGNASASQVVIPPPETVTVTQTETITQTVTETVVQTRTQHAQPQPPVVTTADEERRIDPKLLGVGFVLALALLALAKR